MPKAITPLSDTKARTAKPNAKESKLYDGGELHLHITPSGGKLWLMKYCFTEKEKLLSFGPYPEVSLSEARQNRENTRKQIVNGILQKRVWWTPLKQEELINFPSRSILCLKKKVLTLFGWAPFLSVKLIHQKTDRQNKKPSWERFLLINCMNKQKPAAKIWESANQMRSKIEANEYKD